MLYKVLIHGNSSCSRVARRNASVIRVDVAYVNVCVLRRLKEELGWVIDKWLWLIINTMLFKTVIPVRIQRIMLFLI